MLDDLKILLNISDTARDSFLNKILDYASKRLCIMINEETVPDKLKHIVVEASVVRFNRIGSEGVSNHSVEGESMAFSNNDFAEFKKEINEYLKNKADSSKGKVRFL